MVPELMVTQLSPYLHVLVSYKALPCHPAHQYTNHLACLPMLLHLLLVLTLTSQAFGQCETNENSNACATDDTICHIVCKSGVCTPTAACADIGMPIDDFTSENVLDQCKVKCEASRDGAGPSICRFFKTEVN